ncbi:hypothetical protein F441_17215 [Phytophthora nicotianae CJ01A1]|uniref:Uncharacterized protein n=4 Tax=Phytophthora nicotianae TaxID=4792 RepID=V9EET8_PHYNI|nr:hypothetical protein F443_17341 [Phytophthora nicotianae P1569]ETK76800.1 hypothetical protein L915_16861 [Phytophthora nicotianae]ETP06391.1 hypothetical protein F441_17215 [Phytophthora nicotianae CJ01A1]ETL30226.1 hypothetical protein L916_16768 [Phytophthora nicotianae]ETL83461.1 hypothetical protein L917_16595 [Phytophthora nicotianae]
MYHEHGTHNRTRIMLSPGFIFSSSCGEMDKKLEDEDDDKKAHRVKVQWRLVRMFKDLKTGATATPVVVLVVIGLLVFMETLINYRPTVSTMRGHACSPAVLDANNIEYHSDHRYYSGLRDIGAVPPPQMTGDHAKLCSKMSRLQAKYEYCLPVSGRKDTPFCTAADRMNLLNVKATTICYASVLHMLLMEVYEELQAKRNTPFLAFGSLLGAVRNQSMIPFTEDVDVGYVGDMVAAEKVKLALRRKGYHMFYLDIWRVCVAPTHPLAGHLYDPNLPISDSFAVPYVDLYKMTQTENGDWDMQELEGSNGRILPYKKVWPFSKVTINGMTFETVRDPHFFLAEAYGPDYMTPKPRNESSEFLEPQAPKYP